MKKQTVSVTMRKIIGGYEKKKQWNRGRRKGIHIEEEDEKRKKPPLCKYPRIAKPTDNRDRYSSLSNFSAVAE